MHGGTNSGKLKVIKRNKKWTWPFSLRDPKSLLHLSNEFMNRADFWMLIVIARLLLRLISYSLTLKYWWSAVVVLFFYQETLTNRKKSRKVQPFLKLVTKSHWLYSSRVKGIFLYLEMFSAWTSMYSNFWNMKFNNFSWHSVVVF